MKALLFIFVLPFALAGQACPFCNSKAAKEIRASLFGDDFSNNLLISVLPFIIFSAIIYLIYHGGLPRRRITRSFTNQKK